MLGLEEAFFLAEAYRCLNLRDQAGAPLSLARAWTLFRAAQPNFVARYVAFHYFRARGWVPKSGIKFGVDYVVYRYGPRFHHSEFGVLLQNAVQGSLELLPDKTPRHISWSLVQNLNRLSEQVGKDLMVLYVLEPQGWVEARDAASHECISRFAVSEVIVKRWTPERTGAVVAGTFKKICALRHQSRPQVI